MGNSVDNVAVGKPKVTGSVFSAPKGTALPTDATTALDEAYKCLGYSSDSGLVNSNSPSSTNIKAWGGDVVAVLASEKPDTFKHTLIEAQNVDALKLVYGADNVTGDLDTGITIKANNNVHDENVLVYEIIQNGVAKRIVVPKGIVTAVGDITYSDSGVIGYETTISALPDSAGNTHYEYIKKTS